MKGLVKNVIAGRLFGFICDDQGIEYFFHKDDFIGSWADLVYEYETKGRKRVKVIFDISEKIDKGPRAANVKVVDRPEKVVVDSRDEPLV